MVMLHIEAETKWPPFSRRYFQIHFLKNFFNENVWILLKISLKFFPEVRINDIPALVQIMACRQPGDKPLSELPVMMVSLLMNVCVNWPQWVDSIWISQFPEYDNEKQVGEHFVDCDQNIRSSDDVNKVCRFNIDSLGSECTWQKDYGFDMGQPCVLLKLNMVSSVCFSHSLFFP